VKDLSMRVKNISARPHHVGDVTIIPGDEQDIPDSFASAINKAELVEIVVKSTGFDLSDDSKALDAVEVVKSKLSKRSK
jgi:hypothetical protein